MNNQEQDVKKIEKVRKFSCAAIKKIQTILNKSSNGVNQS